MKIDISEYYSDKILVILDMDSLANFDYVSAYKSSVSNRPALSFKLGDKMVNSTVIFPTLKKIVDTMYYTENADFLMSFDTSPHAMKHIYNKELEQIFSGYSERYNQLVALRNTFKQSGFKILEKEGVESYSLISKAVHDNYEYYEKIFIFTKDKMLYNLVDDKVTLLLSGSKFDLTRENYESELGVPYNLYNLKLITLGDKSLKLEGIKGIGNRTFEKMISDYDNLSTINQMINTSPYFKTREQKELALQIHAWLQPQKLDFLDTFPTKPNLSIFKNHLTLYDCKSLVEKID